MKRAEIVSLLNEIKAACESFYGALEVSIARNPETEDYLLRAKWSPSEKEVHVLNSVVQKYGVEISHVGAFVVFHKPKTAR